MSAVAQPRSVQPKANSLGGCRAPIDRTDAKTFEGIFANQNTVCKLYSAETADFLTRTFGVKPKGAVA